MSISPEALHRANDRISALERELADARAEIGRQRKAITLFTCVIKSSEGWSDECQRVREALATPAPMDELQRLGQEYDAAPSTGEAERLKALGNAEQIAADRAANTTDPREAAVASRIANDIKQLRE